MEDLFNIARSCLGTLMMSFNYVNQFRSDDLQPCCIVPLAVLPPPHLIAIFMLPQPGSQVSRQWIYFRLTRAHYLHMQMEFNELVHTSTRKVSLQAGIRNLKEEEKFLLKSTSLPFFGIDFCEKSLPKTAKKILVGVFKGWLDPLTNISSE